MGAEIYRTSPDGHWGPSNFLHSGYRVFPGGKAAVAWPWLPTPSSAEVKEGVDLHFYSPSGPSWSTVGWTWHFLWDNVEKIVDPDRPQTTVWLIWVACWIPKARNTHSEHVIINALPLQQRLHKSASLLRYTYLACLISFHVEIMMYY
jgi:hypothetical protein